MEVERREAPTALERALREEVELAGGVQVRLAAGGDVVAVAEIIALLAGRTRRDTATVADPVWNT